MSDAAKVKKYLSSGAGDLVNFRHPYTGDAPLHCAAASAHPRRKAVADLLCRRGAALSDKNKEMLTPLHLAADRSHYDVMDLLLKHGAKVNALDVHGQTALHRCAREGNVQACRVLMSYGADPSIASLQGYTAAQLADEPVAKLLAEEPAGPTGADVEYQVDKKTVEILQKLKPYTVYITIL